VAEEGGLTEVGRPEALRPAEVEPVSAKVVKRKHRVAEQQYEVAGEEQAPESLHSVALEAWRLWDLGVGPRVELAAAAVVSLPPVAVQRLS